MINPLTTQVESKLGAVYILLLTMFFVGLIRFTFRSHGPMGSYRLEQILTQFPWWALGLAVVGLICGIWLIRRYDFSFKISFRLLIIGFLLAVLVGGLIVDISGLNDLLLRRGPMRGMMRQYLQENSMDGRPGKIRN